MNITVQRFEYPDTLLKEYEHWVVCLKHEHTTLGTLVLINKSEAVHLGELSTEEWAEFSVVSSECEGVINRVFNAEKYNYLALMMKDPNVHFHMVPRYSNPVVFEGEVYSDIDWPSKTELGKIELSTESWDKLFVLLRGEFA